MATDCFKKFWELKTLEDIKRSAVLKVIAFGKLLLFGIIENKFEKGNFWMSGDADTSELIFYHML